MLARQFSPWFEIRFADDEAYSSFIQLEGFKTFKCLSFDAGEVLECVKRFDFSWLEKQSLEAIFNDQVAVIALLKPVAVFGDTSPTLKMASEKTGVTYISLMNGYMSKYYSFVRQIPERHPAYKFAKALPPGVLNFITGTGEAFTFYKLHRPFAQIRKQHQLRKQIFYLDELEGDINLVCDLQDMFPMKPMPRHYVPIAPLFYDSAAGYTNLAEKIDRGKRTIYVSMGSTGDWQNVAFLNNDHFSRYNIIAAGDKETVLNAAHIISTGFVNVHELFPVTDLVICHGGNGTIYQCLAYGIPVLCATSHFEQQWNVDGLVRCKAGESINGITTLDDYISVVEKWMLVRETAPLLFLKKRIFDELRVLPATIREISIELLHNSRSRKEAAGDSLTRFPENAY